MHDNPMPDALVELLRCHSTPGDEDEVASRLLRHWRDAGWHATAHGRYAVSAVAPWNAADRPTVLVCAHMDSPGFAVESRQNGSLRLVRLGGPRFEEPAVPGVLKSSAGRFDVSIRGEEEDESALFIDDDVEACPGDRVCFRAAPVLTPEGVLESPFLDNRLGCFVVAELASQLRSDPGVNVVVGATASEEFGGFGAPVLARTVEPDLVFCVDATYEVPEQGVLLGGGPVLTLSDASVLLNGRVRDTVQNLFDDFGVPLQTEVYDRSGTDARAFPHQGLAALVLPLLLPSTGNHSPVERASMIDVRWLIEALRGLCRARAADQLLGLTFDRRPA
jgi:putative aminopeptidase FrvX